MTHAKANLLIANYSINLIQLNVNRNNLTHSQLGGYMKFLPFDLDNHIFRHNISEGTTHKPSDFDYLRALSPECILAFKSALDLFKNSIKLGPNSFGSKEAIFLETVISQLCDKDHPEARFTAYQIEDLPKNNQHFMHYDLQKQLKDSNLWSKILSNSYPMHEKNRLLSLKQLWLSDSTHYASHNTDALWFVANNLADFFEHYYIYAFAEYQSYQRKLPKLISVEYGDYLEREKKKIIEFRTELSQVMLQRLQLAAATNDVTYGDHIHYTTLFLHHNSSFTQDFGLPSKRNDLSPEYFQKFIDYILKNGNASQLQSLSNLGLFRCDDEYISWSNKKSILLVPASFYKRKLVPDSAPWFPRLFPNRHFRYQFMEKNVWLFSSLRSLQKHPIDADRIPQFRAHLKSLEQKLEESHSEIQTKKFSGIKKILHYYTVIFTAEWSSYFMESKTCILLKKISILETILNDYKNKQSLNVDFNIISDIIKEISKSIHDNNIPPKECEKFYVTKSKLLEIKSSPTTQVTTKTSTNPFGEKRSENTPPKPTPSTNPFDTPHSTLQKVDNSLFELINNINLISLDEENFNKTISALNITMKSKEDENSTDSLQTLTSANEELFRQLVKHCANLKTHSEYEKYHDKFVAIEQILSSYSPEHIQSRIKDLIALRSSKNFWFLYQLKCRSYIASFENETSIASKLIAHSVVFNSKTTVKHDEPVAPLETLKQ